MRTKNAFFTDELDDELTLDKKGYKRKIFRWEIQILILTKFGSNGKIFQLGSKWINMKLSFFLFFLAIGGHLVSGTYMKLFIAFYIQAQTWFLIYFSKKWALVHLFTTSYWITWFYIKLLILFEIKWEKGGEIDHIGKIVLG